MEEAEIIRDIVCREAGITVDELTGPLRYREYVVARQVLCRLLTDRGLSSTQVGRLIGRDHASVLWSLMRVADAMAAPQSYRDVTALLESCTKAVEASAVPVAAFSPAGRENVPTDGESGGNVPYTTKNDMRP